MNKEELVNKMDELGKNMCLWLDAQGLDAQDGTNCMLILSLTAIIQNGIGEDQAIDKIRKMYRNVEKNLREL